MAAMPRERLVMLDAHSVGNNNFGHCPFVSNHHSKCQFFLHWAVQVGQVACPDCTESLAVLSYSCKHHVMAQYLHTGSSN